jgi:uncharacterized membrane protein (DUF485 family)
MAEFDRLGGDRSPDFRALVASRRRFVTRWGGTAVALCAAFVVVAYLAPDVLGDALGWVIGVGLIMLTWAVSLAYLRRSDRDWAPMVERIVASTREATGRFAREQAPAREEIR